MWAVVAGLRFVQAAHELRAGKQAATEARRHINAAAVADGSAIAPLRRARSKFAAGASATSGPLLWPAKVLPVVGRQVRSAHALSSAARDVSAAAVTALEETKAALDEPESGGPARVRQVRALRDTVVAAQRRVRAVSLGPRRGLVGPLADARDELADKLADATTTLDDAAAGAEAGLRLLAGPRSYLLVAANNAEMRAGSGMWLSGAVLTTTAGRLTLGPMAPLYQVAEPPTGALPAIADADLAARWGATWSPNTDWRALMVSPRMPASAALGAAMWKAAGKPPVDGVLVVDPVALAGIVRATGPVTVEGRTITADQVVPELAHDQYVRFPTATPEQGDRREALGVIASRAFDALDGGRWSPTDLAGELAKAVAGRHLLAWSADPVEQRGWAAAGMAGDLDDDSLLVSLLNRGGNKLDWFTTVAGAIRTTPAGDGTDVAVDLTITNATPSGQPTYIAGPPYGERWAPGLYVGVLTVDVPGAATDVRLAGVTPAVAGPDGAAQVVSTVVQLPRGAQQVVRLSFHVPGRHGRLAVEPSGRTPGMAWRHGAKAWKDTARHLANW